MILATDAAVHELVTNLHDQVNIYRHLLALTQAQVDALQRRDSQAVAALLQEIELGMIERSKVDQRRTRAIDVVAAALRIPADQVTATRLQQAVPEGTAASIASASAELKQLIADLDVVVERSSALLQHELQLVEFMMDGLTVVRDTPTYQRAGTQSDATRRSILDTAV